MNRSRAVRSPTLAPLTVPMVPIFGDPLAETGPPVSGNARTPNRVTAPAGKAHAYPGQIVPCPAQKCRPDAGE